jgi:Flp pilus assembly protein TadB
VITTRRSYKNAKWARQDARWVLLYFTVLFMGVVVKPLFYLAVAVALGLPTFLLVRQWRRKRRWRRDGPPEFWADKIR